MNGEATSRLSVRNVIPCVLFLTFVSITSHFLFSWMGFNPTDDGFYLAFSRRILEGQIPYRDFICARPIGSPLLHTPFVLLDGPYTFWLSRLFVWFQFACIAWSWILIIDRLLETRFTLMQRFLYGLTAFALSSHYFPIMAWSSIDALFFSSIGLALCTETSEYLKMVGYALIGCAPLCRQSFLLMVPASIILIKDWRQARYWVNAFVPVFLVGIYLLVAGAIPDAISQMLSTQPTSLFAIGIKRYLGRRSVPWGPLGLPLGYWAMHLLLGQIRVAVPARKADSQKLLGTLLLYGVLLGAAITLGQGKYLWHPSFCLFGTALGATLYCAKRRTQQLTRIGILALLVAWSVSISVGYNTPALASGVLAVLLIAYSYVSYQSVEENNRIKRSLRFLTAIVVTTVMIGFVVARTTHVYRDRPARELTQTLDGVLPGGKLIKTNPNTYAFLADLQIAIGKAQGQRYAIVPDLAGYWVKSTRANPLLVDWAVFFDQTLLDRFIRDLESHRGDTLVIVQKTMASTLAEGFMPLPENDYPVVQYVRTHFTRIDGTRFFDLYE